MVFGGGVAPVTPTTHSYGAVEESDTQELLSPQHHYSGGSSSTGEDSDDGSSNLLLHTENCYQRAPLLPQFSTPCSVDVTTGGISAAVSSSAATGTANAATNFLNKTAANAVSAVNGLVKIQMPSPHREEPRFPKERLKTLYSFLILVVSGIITNISLAFTHEKMPTEDAPLPDVMLDNLPYLTWGLKVCEIVLISVLYLTIILMVFHKHRFIVFRRVFVVMSFLYIYRAVTMYVTVLPKSNSLYYCSPKHNHTTALDAIQRSLHIMAGFGLSMNGFHTYCGDYIFSGHTSVLVLGYLVVQEYTPKRWWLLHWLYGVVTFSGVVFLLLGRGHYSIDCVLAYFITTRLWYIYHTMATNTTLKDPGPQNYFGRLWWFRLFRYMEGNVGGTLPRQFEWPLPWPRRWGAKLPQRNS